MLSSKVISCANSLPNHIRPTCTNESGLAAKKEALEILAEAPPSEEVENAAEVQTHEAEAVHLAPHLQVAPLEEELQV